MNVQTVLDSNAKPVTRANPGSSQKQHPISTFVGLGSYTSRTMDTDIEDSVFDVQSDSDDFEPEVVRWLCGLDRALIPFLLQSPAWASALSINTCN